MHEIIFDGSLLLLIHKVSYSLDTF